MKRISILSLFAALLAIGYVSADGNTAVSGQGKMKFKVLYKSDHLPRKHKKSSRALMADSPWICRRAGVRPTSR